MAGTLYICATPRKFAGYNSRVLEVLKDVDVIAAEDTGLRRNCSTITA